MLSFFKSQISNLKSQIRTWLAQVTAIDVGRPDDGLTLLYRAGTDLDKTWGELSQEFTDALEAWRNNPLARRLISIVTAYTIGGDGIRLSSTYKPFNRFLQEFQSHPKNNIPLKQEDWADELTRSGEIFPVLFTNPADGMSYIRLVPAIRICRIDWKEGDYETELYYHELPEQIGEEGRIWYSPKAPESLPEPNTREVSPVMLHFAVNRPVGAVRGESDLKPILPWLRRYSRWLEDRVRLNAAVRAFLWIVKVPGNMVKAKAEQYRTPPQPGSVLVVDKDAEEWQVVTPNLAAHDAERDGRAIRWMIVAGGPGTGLTDLGEAETANLATAAAMGELRRRFLRRRQAYFAWALADIAVTAFNRAQALNLRRGRPVTIADVIITKPDIAPEDNRDLAAAARQLALALRDLQSILQPTEGFRRLALRLTLKFAGETVDDQEFERIINPPAFEDRPARAGALLTPLGDNGHVHQSVHYG